MHRVAPSPSTSRSSSPALGKRDDPPVPTAYVLLCTVICVSGFVSLLAWIALVEWGVSDGYPSELPVISAGLADNAAIRGVFIFFILFHLGVHVAFWVWFDRATGGVAWWTRAVALVVRQGALVLVGACSMRTWPNGHGLAFNVALVAHVVYEVMCVVHRAIGAVRRPLALSRVLLGLEVACLFGLLAALSCFRAPRGEECVGGLQGQVVYEYVTCVVIPLCVAFMVLDG